MIKKIKNLWDGCQEAHVLGEASLVLEGGSVVEFVYVRGHTSPFHSFMQKQTFLEENSQHNCVNGGLSLLLYEKVHDQTPKVQLSLF